MADSGTSSSVGMADVLEALKSIQENQTKLASEVESVSLRLDTLAPSSQVPSLGINRVSTPLAVAPTSPIRTTLAAGEADSGSTSPTTKEASQAQKSGFTSRIILT